MEPMKQPNRYRIRRICKNGDGGTIGPFVDSVEEIVIYSHEVPYSVVWQSAENLVSKPHFANNTLEVIVTFGANGYYDVGDKRIDLSGKDVLFIPPGVVHSSELHGPKNSSLLNLKFDFSMLKYYVDIEGMFAHDGYSISDLLYCQADYIETVNVLDALINADGNLFLRTARIVELFSVWEKHLQDSFLAFPDSHDARLNKLVRWTRENYMNHVSIDDAAKTANMSRSYFCKYFKEHVGMTYVEYLNRMRINQATTMLMNGFNASEACDLCGFTDLPYFVQLFKKITGFTTREYLQYCSKMKETLKNASTGNN